MDPQHGFQINFNSEVQVQNDQFQFLSWARLPAKCQIVVTFQQLFALDKKTLLFCFLPLTFQIKGTREKLCRKLKLHLGIIDSTSTFLYPVLFTVPAPKTARGLKPVQYTWAYPNRTRKLFAVSSTCSFLSPILVMVVVVVAILRHQDSSLSENMKSTVSRDLCTWHQSQRLQLYCNHRRRIKTEDKTKVVGEEFIQVLAALAV